MKRRRSPCDRSDRRTGRGSFSPAIPKRDNRILRNLTGGRAVVFEAKHTDSDRIDYNRLTPEQLSSLEEHDRLGAAAFILVSVELQDFYRVPWGVWRDMRKLYGHKHMNKAELEPFRVQYIAGVLKLLEGIELEYGEQEETV